jgi:heme-degrading monooxygenase HmoA
MLRVIELFVVSPDEDEAFLAAWTAEAPHGATLHRGLRSDVHLRFASLTSGAPDGAGGVLLIVPFDVPPGEDERFLAAWEATRERFSARRGCLGAQLLHGLDARFVAVVHWSSPLMYARTVREEGDLIAALPFAGPAALYVRAAASPLG